MRYSFINAALVGIAVAAPAPAPQDIAFDLVAALPNPTYTTVTGATQQIVTYDATSILDAVVPQITSNVAIDDSVTGLGAVSSTGLVKRTACQAQPTGVASPTVSTDTPAAFTDSPDFSSIAVAAPTPSGYSQTFQNLKASNNAYGYMGYTTLSTYDVNTCAAKCNAINGCQSFNIYFERDPSQEPAAACPNPGSYTMIKCVFWGGPVNAANANNAGQYRQNFQVVIAGSNGYQNNSIATPPGYTFESYSPNAAINAPLDSYGYDSYVGPVVFNSGPFSVQLCADACTLHNQYAYAHPASDGSPVKSCQFFDTYILYINNTKNLQGQYCAMYSENWGPSYLTNVGQYNGPDHYMIEYSYTYYNTSMPGSANKNGAIHQASVDVSYHGLATYCSTLLGYTTPVTTTTATATITPTSTATATVTVSSCTITTKAGQKRDATAVPSPPVVIYASDVSSLLSATSSVANSAAGAKRTLTTPAALTQYPGAVITSACSLNATSVTTTSTATATTTVTAAAVTVTSTATTTSVNVATVTTFKALQTGKIVVQAADCGDAVNGFYLGFDHAFNPQYEADPVRLLYDASEADTFTLDSGSLLQDLRATTGGEVVAMITTHFLYVGDKSVFHNQPMPTCSIAADNTVSCGGVNFYACLYQGAGYYLGASNDGQPPVGPTCVPVTLNMVSTYP